MAWVAGVGQAGFRERRDGRLRLLLLRDELRLVNSLLLRQALDLLVDLVDQQVLLHLGSATVRPSVLMN